MTSLTDNRLLYQKIYDDLEGKIASGQIGYMEQLPVLADLCEQYGVSAASVRRALDELERAGLVRRQRGRGKGTFAVKRLTTSTLRVLLVGEYDLYRTPIELVHEVFDIIAGIRDAAHEHGATVTMVSNASYATLPPASAGTGYLILAMMESGFEVGRQMAEHHGVPYVLINPPSAMAPCVRVDMAEAAYLGVNYLAQLGHTQIAYVGGTRGEWSVPRFEGYQRALTKGGLTFDPALVQETDGVEVAQDEAALDRLMSLPHPPTAIFAASDYRALHLLAYAKRQGIGIPHQLSLCGYDNISEVAEVEPALTSVHHPRYELGREAVRLLSRLLSGEKVTVSDVREPSRVVVRASTIGRLTG